MECYKIGSRRLHFAAKYGYPIVVDNNVLVHKILIESQMIRSLINFLQKQTEKDI